MTEAITIIQTRRSAMGSGLLHHTIAFSNKSNHSVEIPKRSRQVLAAIRRSVPFRSAH